MSATFQYFRGTVAAGLETVFTNPCYVQEVDAQNMSPDGLWLQLFDVDAGVAPGETAVYSFYVASGGTLSFSLPYRNGLAGLTGRRFELGLAIAWSTTPGIYTAYAGASESQFYACGLVDD